MNISLYNVLGKLERVFVDQHVNAGNYMLKIDASQLSSGLYFYRIQAEGFTETKKMTLMK